MEQPTNTNFLSQLGFHLIIKRLPEVQYFIQGINIPGINLGAANQPTPFAMPVPYSGDLTYNDLTITFKLDEELKGYLSIWNWMVGLGFPHDFDQYKELAEENKSPVNPKGMLYSDIKLVVLDNKQNAKLEVTFEDCFPTTLSDIEFATTDPTVMYLTANATFKYTLYTISKI